MKLRSLVTIAALALGTVSGMAQATYTAKDGTEYTFKKHLFLDLQGGAQYTLGEAKFDKLISPERAARLGLSVQSLVRHPSAGQCLAEQGRIQWY